MALTLILRLQPEAGGVFKGTVERPGYEGQVFRDVEGMIEILAVLASEEVSSGAQPQVGND